MSTASTHITVLLNEAVDALNIKPSGTYIDGTFGRGGHSRKILSKLDKDGRLFAIDRDLAAIATGNSISDARFNISHRHFSEINQLAVDNNLTRVPKPSWLNVLQSSSFLRLNAILAAPTFDDFCMRSEERRVGKECCR